MEDYKRFCSVATAQPFTEEDLERSAQALIAKLESFGQGVDGSDIKAAMPAALAALCCRRDLAYHGRAAAVVARRVRVSRVQVLKRHDRRARLNRPSQYARERAPAQHIAPT